MEININHDEALVLFEFLARIDKINLENIFDDQSEQIVLWNIESQLEKTLVEPFDPNYLKLLKEARERIKESIGR